MEKKLKRLFDYQKYADNRRLAKMIEDTETRYGEKLTDEDLEMVSAAGVPVLPLQKGAKRK